MALGYLVFLILSIVLDPAQNAAIWKIDLDPVVKKRCSFLCQ